jgi:hypothetical protein
VVLRLHGCVCVCVYVSVCACLCVCVCVLRADLMSMFATLFCQACAAVAASIYQPRIHIDVFSIAATYRVGEHARAREYTYTRARNQIIHIQICAGAASQGNPGDVIA